MAAADFIVVIDFFEMLWLLLEMMLLVFDNVVFEMPNRVVVNSDVIVDGLIKDNRGAVDKATREIEAILNVLKFILLAFLR